MKNILIASLLGLTISMNAFAFVQKEERIACPSIEDVKKIDFDTVRISESIGKIFKFDVYKKYVTLKGELDSQNREWDVVVQSVTASEKDFTAAYASGMSVLQKITKLDSPYAKLIDVVGVYYCEYTDPTDEVGVFTFIDKQDDKDVVNLFKSLKK